MSTDCNIKTHCISHGQSPSCAKPLAHQNTRNVCQTPVKILKQVLFLRHAPRSDIQYDEGHARCCLRGAAMLLRSILTGSLSTATMLDPPPWLASLVLISVVRIL